MIYEYYCEKCEKVIEKEFEFGKADKEIKCEICNNIAHRHFDGCNFKCYGPSSNYKFKEQNIKKNEEAGMKMRKTWEGTQPKLTK